jgi:hypothetical protein
MILEHAPLEVVPNREAEFETAFQEAAHIIGAMTGFRSLRLERCLEQRNKYLLLVEGIASRTTPKAFAGQPTTNAGGRCCTTSTTRSRRSSTTRRS